MIPLLKPLDRYVFREFIKVFLASAVGFPLLVIVIRLTDNLDLHLARHVTRGEIAMAYLYYLPQAVFFVLPAAVLFATIFTVSSATRYSEIAAAKASGVRFHRYILPIFVGAMVAAGLDFALGEWVPTTNRRSAELLKDVTYRVGSDRYNFTYVGDEGRVYKVVALSVSKGILNGVEIIRKGTGVDYPTYLLTAKEGTYTDSTGWRLRGGTLHVIGDSANMLTMQFDSVADHQLRERPEQLAVSEKLPDEMNYRELGRYITAMERSGAKVDKSRVERMLKIVIPMTCIFIVIFGAPLATSTERGGAAYGAGLSLGSTMLFLMLNQLTRAIGGSGLIIPEVAAWLPTAAFALVGLILLTRVRT